MLYDQELSAPGTLHPQTKIDKILIAYDFSSFADVALEYGTLLARKHDSQVVLLYAQAPSDSECEGNDGLRALKLARDEMQHELEAVRERLSREGISSTPVCRIGMPVDVIVQYAAEIRPDLMLFGASGHGWDKRRAMGSTAEFLLRCLPCPTLTIGPRALSSKEILLPHRQIIYATSIPSRLGKAARFARIFAQAWDAELEILHVVDDDSLDYQPRRNAEMDVKGAALAEEFNSLGVRAQWRLWVGSPSRIITRRSIELNAGMIIFGIEHRTLDPNVFGIISGTIQHAACPILTVPGEA